ncbi:MAG: hypothetical protein HFH85_20105 [Lachnospiraceae bacterium]|jgi:hypothetical protein|nr:hypothetical protein [Lachnospiraceae bacterium]
MNYEANNLRISSLVQELRKYKRLMVYGAGKNAEILVKRLEERNICVAGVVVTKKEKWQKSFCGKPLYEFKEALEWLQDIDTVTVLALKREFEQEVVRLLYIYDNIKYIEISKFLYEDEKNLITYYQGKDRKQYMFTVAERYLDNHPEINETIEGYAAQLECHIDRREKEFKKIVFVVEDIKPRVLKMMKALQRAGIMVDVLVWRYVNDSTSIIKDLFRTANSCHYFETIEELMHDLIQSDAKVLHFFTNICRCNNVCILLFQKSLFPNIVVERYDILTGMHYSLSGMCQEEFGRQMLLERYAIEHAEGICFRDYSEEFLTNRLGFCIEGKTIRFLDYCEKERFATSKKNDEEELSICYAGSIMLDSAYKKSDSINLWNLAEICEKNQCHLHVYPLRWDEARITSLQEMVKTNIYFHLHKTIPYERLAEELSQYDYAVHPVNRSILDESCYVTSSKVKYAATNKFFDSLEAGIPIIIKTPQKMAEEFTRQDIAIPWFLEEYNFSELRRKKEKLRDLVAARRNDWCIDNYIAELIKFYKGL